MIIFVTTSPIPTFLLFKLFRVYILVKPLCYQLY